MFTHNQIFSNLNFMYGINMETIHTFLKINCFERVKFNLGDVTLSRVV